MGVAARRARRRASGTLTLTRPGSSPGGWSPALAVLAGVAPGCGLPGADGGRIAAGQRWLGGGDCQQGLGAHRQYGVAVEGVPYPDLVLVHAGLTLSVGEAFFNRPSLPCDLDQDGQGYWPVFRGVAVVERQVSRV